MKWTPPNKPALSSYEANFLNALQTTEGHNPDTPRPQSDTSFYSSDKRKKEVRYAPLSANEAKRLVGASGEVALLAAILVDDKAFQKHMGRQ